MENTPKVTMQLVEPGVTVEAVLKAVVPAITHLIQTMPLQFSLEESLILGGDGGVPKSLVRQKI